MCCHRLDREPADGSALNQGRVRFAWSQDRSLAQAQGGEGVGTWSRKIHPALEHGITARVGRQQLEIEIDTAEPESIIPVESELVYSRKCRSSSSSEGCLVFPLLPKLSTRVQAHKHL